ncbi:alpha/beta hydrolase [Marinobacter bryozoorum]|uniref:alpha/beta fold hydrolase n=1 Tax=Marinobacter bryozoorum TaxID=256324 RepID=UPI002004A891|nr:alpha/beta hydrolase [Marinobacter bryozoorum]
MAIWRWGHSGPAVLLVHGWDSRASHLGSFVEPLLAAGYQVVAFDGPGHGESGGHHSNVVLLGQSILQVVAAAGPVQAAVGHSMGSPALLYAFAHGLEVDASVHLAGPSSFRRVLERTALQTGLDAGGQRALMTLMEAETGIPIETMEMSHLARGLRHPSLLLHDPEDREVPFEESRELGAAWPLSTLHAVSGVGHRRILGDSSVLGLSTDFLRRTLPVNDDSMQ